MIKYRYRSIWIANVPLETFDTRLDALLEFLRTTRSDRLYIIGDQLNGAARKFLQHQRKHSGVIYVTGTHDVFRRLPLHLKAGGVRVSREAIHHAADGRRYLVVNGPEDNAALRSAEAKGMDGIISGRWVGNCLALVEDQTGHFGLVHFGEAVFHAPGSGVAVTLAEVDSGLLTAPER